MLDMTTPIPESAESRRLRLAIDLHEAGMDIALQRMKRENPDESEAVAKDVLRTQLRDRPLPNFAPAPSYLTPRP